MSQVIKDCLERHPQLGFHFQKEYEIKPNKDYGNERLVVVEGNDFDKLNPAYLGIGFLRCLTLYQLCKNYEQDANSFALKGVPNKQYRVTYGQERISEINSLIERIRNSPLDRSVEEKFIKGFFRDEHSAAAGFQQYLNDIGFGDIKIPLGKRVGPIDAATYNFTKAAIHWCEEWDKRKPGVGDKLATMILDLASISMMIGGAYLTVQTGDPCWLAGPLGGGLLEVAKHYSHDAPLEESFANEYQIKSYLANCVASELRSNKLFEIVEDGDPFQKSLNDLFSEIKSAALLYHESCEFMFCDQPFEEDVRCPVISYVLAYACSVVDDTIMVPAAIPSAYCLHLLACGYKLFRGSNFGWKPLIDSRVYQYLIMMGIQCNTNFLFESDYRESKNSLKTTAMSVYDRNFPLHLLSQLGDTPTWRFLARYYGKS